MKQGEKSVVVADETMAVNVDTRSAKCSQMRRKFVREWRSAAVEVWIADSARVCCCAARRNVDVQDAKERSTRQE
jgi:hypothetical protein